MGLIITELKKRKPELPYFDESFEGGISGGSAVYESVSLRRSILRRAHMRKSTKITEKKHCMLPIFCRAGYRGYRAIWKHIMHVSVTDLKKNYEKLNVEFDLWKGEADAQQYIPDMVQRAQGRRIRAL